MKIKVENKKLEIIDEEIINAGDYNVDVCEFEFINEEYKNLIKVAVFCKDEKVYKRELKDDKCLIPVGCLKSHGYIFIGLYLYEKEEEILKLRYSFSPVDYIVDKGSYVEGEEEKPIFPDLSKFLKQDNIWQGDHIKLEYIGDNIVKINADVEGIEPYDDTEIRNEISGLNNAVVNIHDNINDIENSISNLNTQIETKANKTEETQLIGWTSIVSNKYQELDLNPYLEQEKHRFTILVYIRKDSNRQAIKFELTTSELNKLISKGLASINNTLVITRSCQGISNVNKIAMVKQTMKKTETDGIIQLKYEIYEDGISQSGLNNFEFCMYAE